MHNSRRSLYDFTPEMLYKTAASLREKTLPLSQVTVTDRRQAGLRAIIRVTGIISFHCSYAIGDAYRPYIKIGEFPSMTIATAREIANTIQLLAVEGIDPFADLVESRIRAIQSKGVKWRPSSSDRHGSY